MLTNSDIQRAAELLIRKHGDKAERIAVQRLSTLSASESVRVRAIWEKIVRAIREL